MTERTPDRRDGLQEFKQPSLSSVSTSLSGVRGDGCLAAAACILGCDPESVPTSLLQPLTFGSLFAGIGGFDLGFERSGMMCRWQVEINSYCQKVLAKH